MCLLCWDRTNKHICLRNLLNLGSTARHSTPQIVRHRSQNANAKRKRRQDTLLFATVYESVLKNSTFCLRLRFLFVFCDLYLIFVGTSGCLGPWVVRHICNLCKLQMCLLCWDRTNKYIFLRNLLNLGGAARDTTPEIVRDMSQNANAKRKRRQNTLFLRTL